MPVVASEWVLPIDRPPIRRGWIDVDQGRIVRVGSGTPPPGCEALGSVAILPGLVNAHTHLELSWMAGRVKPAASMSDWIQALMRLRTTGPTGGLRAVDRAARKAARQMAETGTAIVGDISNTLSCVAALKDAGLRGVVFHEVIGFNTVDPVSAVADAWTRVSRVVGDEPDAAVRASVVAHAPYSVSPALFREIARCRRDTPLSVHLAESAEEVEFLRTGGGPIRAMLERLEVWVDSWEVPACEPVRFIERVGYLRSGLLAVHAVHVLDSDLERLRRARAVVVTCPRSNAWVGTGPPRLARIYASGVRVAIGTDSLASCPTLNVFDELAEMRRIAPEVAAASLLESATRVGAEALGFGPTHGTLGAGKSAHLVAVDVPADVGDVEEYLVSGVPAASVRPLRL